MELNIKDLTQSLLALLIVGGAVATLFIPVQATDGTIDVLRVLAGTVVGFYYGQGSLPTFGARKQ